jgi:hypothetical protein
MFEPRYDDKGHGRPDGEPAFLARWQSAPPRFAAWGEPAGPSAAPTDPSFGATTTQAGEDLWLTGFAAGRAEAEADLAREADAMDALLKALDRLAPLPDAAFAERLEQEVRALLMQLVGSASVDEALLVERCAALADLASKDSAVALHANPADATLLVAAQPELTIIADERLPRGELLLVDGAGEAATGPRTMLADWAAQAGDPQC